MASGEDGKERIKPSRIPRYIKTKVPIESREYKNVLKRVKDTRLEIEEKEAEVGKLLVDFERLKITRTESDQSKTSEKKIEVLDRSASVLRKVIRTPGGTKRKVKPSHLKFKFELEDALGKIVEVSSGSSLKADDLLQKLQKKFPASRSIDRRTVLKTTSQLFGKKLERRGKKKEGFYIDLAFKVDSGEESPGHVEDPSFSSPQYKMMREQMPSSADVAHKGSCRGKLQFTGTIAENTPLSDAVDLSGDEDEIKSQACTLILENESLKEKIRDLEETLSKQQDVSNCLVSSQNEVIELYKSIVGDGSLLGGMLSLSERNEIKLELTKAKEFFNLGIREKKEIVDLEKIINPLLFNQLLVKVKEHCPTITNILEQLVLSRNAFRNVRKTEAMKMKASIHLLSSLMDVRDQNAHNDIQVLFGLLCISYGARSSMIEVLQHIGLSESFPVLCGVLKKQLEHYKKLIHSRLPPDCPVVTYQDNLQIQRTSMRHLRLSKLQKDKKKQDKIWDFTVRGWRVADISGINDMFKDPLTAKQPQRNVSDVTFEHLNIECHKEHHDSWLDFRERNLLRKMDLAFNQTQCSPQELKCATSDRLREISEFKVSKNAKPFLIEVPPVPEEFADSCNKSQIYPLPISTENQCTTLGLARNLDKFKEEFDFTNNESKTFLPLKKSKREFNLDLAYERYAFLKTMEIHKQEQEDYELFLRKSTEHLIE